VGELEYLVSGSYVDGPVRDSALTAKVCDISKTVTPAGFWPGSKECTPIWIPAKSMQE